MLCPSNEELCFAPLDIAICRGLGGVTSWTGKGGERLIFVGLNAAHCLVLRGFDLVERNELLLTENCNMISMFWLCYVNGRLVVY